MKSTKQTHDPFAVRWLLFMAVLICLTMLAMASGCSTVSGAAGLVRGIAQDIEDVAEGTRSRMSGRR